MAGFGLCDGRRRVGTTFRARVEQCAIEEDGLSRGLSVGTEANLRQPAFTPQQRGGPHVSGFTYLPFHMCEANPGV